MTATDELRRLLDERGVEYEGNKDVTRFFGYDGFEVVMQEDIDGKLDCLTPLYLTPEQAVEATLGSDLKAENEKLRELVLDAWGDGHPDRSCDGCDIRDECHDDVERMRKDGVLRFSRCLFELRIEERMRELGIEVD